MYWLLGQARTRGDDDADAVVQLREAVRGVVMEEGATAAAVVAKYVLDAAPLVDTHTAPAGALGPNTRTQLLTESST